MSSSKCHRVLWVVQGSNWIGEQTEFLHLAKRLPTDWSGCLVFLKTPDNLDSIQQLLSLPQITVTSLGMRGFHDLPLICLRFLRLIRRFRPNVVHSHHPPANLINGWSKLVSKVLFSHRYMSIFGYRNAAHGIRLRGLIFERVNLLFADQVICSSPGVERSYFGDAHLLCSAEELRESHRKHWTIFNAVDVDYLRLRKNASLEARDVRLLGDRRDVRRVISVAAFKEQKGHRTLLEAFQKLCTRLSDVELILVGDGPLRTEMEKFAHSLGIASNCMFCGHQRDPVLWLARSDVFVLASYWEGLPKALLEAMALDLPCIGTRVQGIEDVLDDDSLVDTKESLALASKLENFLVNPNLRKQKILEQRASINKFDISITSKLIFDIYRSYIDLERS